ncbi:MAG: hypothetical protein Q9169_006878 [Polycauliona sp. 2 TL-2023]
MAGSSLPSGPDLETYWTSENHDTAHTLPWSKSIGTCTLMVELAGPLGDALDHVALVPDHIRGLAGFVIQECPGGGDANHNLGDSTTELGGLFLSPNHPDINPFSGSRFDYVVVTVQHSQQPSRRAGDTDVNVAEKVLGFTRQLWDSEDSQPHKDWYWQLGEKLEAKVAEMSSDQEEVNWWEPVASGRRNKMDYRCLDSVDGPAVVDCVKLQYQGFGEGALGLHAGETRYLNQGTCALAVSTTKAVILSWDQVSAAFGALFVFCVDHPLLPSKGGRATPTLGGFGSKAKRNRTADITGLNALPEGAMINIWKHSGDQSNLPRELSAVLKAQHPPS